MNIESPCITVIIPSFKAEKYISRAIDSVLAQEEVAVKIIVVEDGVFDNTGRIVRSYNENVSLVALDNNHGACFARNKGLSLVEDDFVLFLDADDFLEGRLLRGLYDSITQNVTSVTFGPRKVIFETSKQSRIYYPLANETPEAVIARWISGNSGPSPCSILWRKSELIRIGGWNEAYAKNQDGELIIRALFNGCTVSHSLEGAGVYWQYDGERISNRFDEHSFESLEMLETYIEDKIREKHSLNPIIRDALGYFRANVAALAYTHKHPEIAACWEGKWARVTPSMRDLEFISIRIFMIHLLYRIFGIRRGVKAYDSIRLLKIFLIARSEES